MSFKFCRVAGLALTATLAASGAALADCSTEVALGVQAMGKQKFIRKETNAFGATGPFKLVVEYHTPDRMRQIMTPLTEDKPVEAVVVGEKAWTNAGDGWTLSGSNETQQLITYMIKSSAQMFQEVGKFECVGLETVEGRELRAYKGVNAMKEQAPGVKGEPQQVQNEAVRMMYLDPKTGLPARSIFARAGALDKPIFREVYTYPEDLKIEPPKDVKP